MKIIFLLLVLLIFVNIENLFSQNKYSYKRNNPGGFGAVNIVNSNHDFRNSATGSVKTVLPNSGINLTNASAPQGSRRFIKACYLITPLEMSYSQFGSSVVESVGWTWIALVQQSIVSTGNLKVYLQSTPDVAYSKGLNFLTATSSMTKVIDGTISIPSGEGTYSIDVPVGGPGTSSFIPIEGEGIYVAFDYTTIGSLATPLGAPTISCNDSLSSSIAFYTHQTTNSNTLSISDFRPETRFGDSTPDTVEVCNIYALGEIPFPWGFPDTIGIRLQNNEPHGANLLNVQSVNQINSQIVFDTTFTLSPSATLINVALPTLINPQSDLVIVKAIPGDVLDHQLQYCHEVTPDAYNHADPCLPENGGLGFTGANGNFVAGFSNYSSQSFPIDAVDHCFINDSSGGLQLYNILIYDDNGFGQPGTLLYISPLLISPVGNTSSQKVTHNLTSSVIIPANRRFYIGYRQLHFINISACFQDEIPVREKTFFYSTPTTSNTWIDFANDSAFFRLDISPRTCKNLKLKVYLEGFYNGSTMISDKAVVQVKSFYSPYSLVAQDTSHLDSNGTGYFNFPAVNRDSSYYFVVLHRNHIETWSHAVPEKIDSCDKFYDFTNASGKAYGSNMIFVTTFATMSSAGGYAIYTGDVNQDEFIDATDCAVVDNDVFNFITGYVNTDLNGDLIVDATDASYCDNNAFNFISSSHP